MWCRQCVVAGLPDTSFEDMPAHGIRYIAALPRAHNEQDVGWQAVPAWSEARHGVCLPQRPVAMSSPAPCLRRAGPWCSTAPAQIGGCNEGMAGLSKSKGLAAHSSCCCLLRRAALPAWQSPQTHPYALSNPIKLYKSAVLCAFITPRGSSCPPVAPFKGPRRQPRQLQAPPTAAGESGPDDSAPAAATSPGAPAGPAAEANCYWWKHQRPLAQPVHPARLPGL